MEAENKKFVSEGGAPVCGPEFVYAYLDGMLSPEALMAFEAHLDACAVCRESVNSEKVFAGMLDNSLVGEPSVPLPADFAKRVAVTAESTVVGTGDRSNTVRAIAIVSGLLCVAVAAIMAAGGQGIPFVGIAIEKIGVIVLAVVHLVYSIGVSVAVIIRSATAPVVDQPLLVPFIVVIMAAAGLLLLRVRQSRSGDTAN